MGKKYFVYPHWRATGYRRFQFFAGKKRGAFTQLILYSIILIFQIGCKTLIFKSSKKEKKIEVVSEKVNTGKALILSNDQKIENTCLNLDLLRLRK